MAAGRAGDGQGPGEAGEGGVSRQLAGAGAPAPAISSAVIKAGAAPPSLPPLSGPHQTLITAAGFYGERFGPLPASSASLTLRKHGADILAGSGLGHCLETARARPPTSISLADPADRPDRAFRCTAPASAPALSPGVRLSEPQCCWPRVSVPAPCPAQHHQHSPGVSLAFRALLSPHQVPLPPGQWSWSSFAVPRVLGMVSAFPAVGGTRSYHSSANFPAPL